MTQTLLTQEQFDLVVEKIKDNVKIPVVEDLAVRLAVGFVLGKAEDILPEDWITEIKEALNTGNLDPVINKTVNVLNEKINVPLIGEETEASLLRGVIEAVTEAIIEGGKIALEKAKGLLD